MRYVGVISTFRRIGDAVAIIFNADRVIALTQLNFFCVNTIKVFQIAIQSKSKVVCVGFAF